jgi:YVTN family beta-propeller protein
MRALRTPLWILVLFFVTLSICQGKTNYAYVANYSDGNVSVINTSNNTVVKTITVGTNPFAVAVDQAGKNVYVANYGSANVSVISTSSNAVVATIPVQTQPEGVVVSPSGKTAYVANGGSGSVSVVNTGTKKVTVTITVGKAPAGMGILANGTFLYVVNYGSDNVSVISTLTNAVVATVTVGGGPAWVAVSPDGSMAYVTNQSSNSVSVIQTANNTVVNTITGLASGVYGDAVSIDGHWLYVASAGVVNVIDTNTQSVVATIPTGGNGYTLVSFSQDSAFAYVTESTNSVAVINTATKTVAATVTVGGTPTGVAVMGLMKVSTVAGGYVGDKGAATKAALGAPYSSVLDGAGNLFISDVIMHRIRKVDASGNITTYAGNGICGYNGENVKASSSMVCGPNGLALDTSGNLIFADGANGRIRKIDHSTQLVTTVAGNGVFGYDPSQDGGPALNAAIGQSFQITYDAAGNLYFDQVGNCVVRKVDTSGTITTVAGTGTCGYNGDNIPAKTAQLNLPRGVAFDSNGNLYIGDTQNHRVRKVNSSGTITTFAGTGTYGFSCNGGPATSANVGNPRGLNVFNNALYIGNGGALMCAVDLTTNNASTYAGSFFGYDGDGHSLTASEFYSPTFVLFDASGNPVFDDDFNGRVRKATGGILSTIAGGYVGEGVKATSGTFEFAEALAVDKAGNLYIADETGNRIRKVSGGKISTIAGSLQGITGYSGDGGPATSATLNQPQGVAVDSTGNVYIADTYNGVIREVSSGNIKTFATNSNFNYLLQMAVDGSNNVYVADAGACVIWKITTGGTVSIAAGVLNACGYSSDGIPATSAQLNGPYGIAFDSNGNMLIADNGNNRVREVNTSGIISTVAGNGTFGYTGDGGSATAAEVCPNSVAVDKSGTIYVADFNFERIRKISGGIITTFAGAGYGFNGDGLWPLYTTFDDPVALAVDSKGTVYELDDSDHRVRAIK